MSDLLSPVSVSTGVVSLGIPTAPASKPKAKPLLIDRVNVALESSPHLSASSLRVEAAQGQVKLNGRVGTFFEKQMAQEVVRRLDGVEGIENLLEVNWG